MKYLTYDGYKYVTKNKLEKAVQDYLTGLDRTLIKDNEALAVFKREVSNQVVKLNREHFRCKPLEIKWWSPNGMDHCINGIRFSTFTIYGVKHEFKN